jgi:Sulfatase-modifying factor enzyme 1
MTRRRMLTASAAIALVLTIATYLLFFSDLFSPRQEVHELANDENLLRIPLAPAIDLRLVRLYEEEAVYVTESPITNAQYAVAVAEDSVSAPQLPHELYPGEGVTRARWEEIAWSAGTYRKGQGPDAVLFVNHADADAYCRWLERKNHAYQFRLPSRMEQIKWSPQKAIPSKRLQDSDSAFRRPASGPGAIRIRERFWLAPWTHELVDVSSTGVEDEFKVSYLHRFAPSGRYRPILAGSIGTARLVPTTFRVIAVKKTS